MVLHLRHLTTLGAASTEDTRKWLEALLRLAPIVLFSFDREGVVTLAEGRGLSGACGDGKGYVGRSIFELFAHYPWTLECARRALSGESNRASGQLWGDSFFEAYLEPIWDEAGEVAGGIGIGIDVTEREKAMGEVRSQQALLRYIIANVPHSVFWKDPQGRYLGGNQNFLNDAGVGTLDRLIGKNDYDFWPREHSDFFLRIDREVMETGQPKLEVEEPILRPDGQARTVLTSKVPIRDETGKVTGLLGIYADITERKRMELELKRAKEEAEKASRAKSDFLTVMSHELRTPLTLIMAPLESILSGGNDQGLPLAVRTDLERSLRNAKRLHRLVSDILDYQKLEAGRMQLDWESVDAVELVSHFVEDALGAARQKGIELHADLEQSLPPLQLDRGKFEQIVANLLGNALKFTPTGGRVTVGLHQVDGMVELSVRDTGPGIPLDKQHLLFQRFQQIDDTLTRRHEGTGIGLALVKQLTEAMGGNVGVVSEPGRGALFTVRLVMDTGPVRNTSVGKLSAPPPVDWLIETPKDERAPAAPETAGRPHVLVAEDNADLRDYLKDLLGGEYRVTLAENGKRALEFAEQLRPDVILSDIMMSEMDGCELVRLLKGSERLKSIPVILLTAKAGREEVVRGLEVGADDYLSKPFSPAELMARVRAAERLHRVYLQLEEKTAALNDTVKRLEETYDQLVQSGKMAAVGTLMAGLSHELNNPLASILMHAQLLLRSDTTDPRTRRSLQAIEKQGARSARLVQSLLDYSRRGPRERQPCKLEPVVDEILELCRPHALRRDVGLKTELEPSLPCITVHLPGLESALMNLLGNALDAAPFGGQVVLSAHSVARREFAGVELAVRDNGAGIPPQVMARLFEPFVTTKPPGQGTGLGLALTYAFVESHDGEIHVDSSPEHGTTFRVWLPVDRDGRDGREGAPADSGAPLA